jgi:hypothetical protein
MHPDGHDTTEGDKLYLDQFGTEWSDYGVWDAACSFGYAAVLRAEVDGDEVVVLVNEDNENDVYHLIECEQTWDEHEV